MKPRPLVKLGILQTRSYPSNQKGVEVVSKMLVRAAKSETDIVCLPEQWQKENKFGDFDVEFAQLKRIAKEYSMTIIPGAFYQKKKNGFVISAPVIDGSGEIIGTQEKIHPFDYEKAIITAGTKVRVFNTSCRFGIIICYDLVFSDVAESLVKKGAQVLFSPSRIVKRGISPWHMYAQVRALENRIPVLAANVQNNRFGGNSIIVDLVEDNNVMIPKTITLHGQAIKSVSFDLSKYEKSRKRRYLDHRRFA
jgi:predicted amidohydrolase